MGTHPDLLSLKENLVMKKIRFSLLVSLICWMAVLGGVASAALDDEKNNIQVYQMASPAVVHISSVTLSRDFFFNPVPREGTGSGMILDQKGYILTNYHVIKDARRVEVTLTDGSKWKAKYVGADPDNDLAVIQIQAPQEKLRVIPLGDSTNLQVGQKVLAIGNPFGLNQTLTVGIISSLKRSIRSETGTIIEDLIQTDAAINPGNSGGPLLNAQGEIIGVNTAIISPTGGSVGIGFAIPIQTAKRIIPELIAKGQVDHAWLGAVFQPLTPELAQILKLTPQQGVMVLEVVPGGPADKAGIKGATETLQLGNFLLNVGGDILTEIDQVTLRNGDDLIQYISQKRPGDKIQLKYYRQNQPHQIQLTLGKRPAPKVR
jgi:putative serine protease PepD